MHRHPDILEQWQHDLRSSWHGLIPRYIHLRLCNLVAEPRTQSLDRCHLKWVSGHRSNKSREHFWCFWTDSGLKKSNVLCERKLGMAPLLHLYLPTGAECFTLKSYSHDFLGQDKKAGLRCDGSFCFGDWDQARCHFHDKNSAFKRAYTS